MNKIEGKNRQTLSDRRLGYSILFILMCIILGCVGYAIHLAKNPQAIRVIAFDEIGNLKIDDPVSLKGIGVGAVGDIKLRPHKVLVFIRTRTILILHRGYKIDSKDIGIMGDCALSIEDGDPAAPPVPGDDTLAGTFHPGVSEAVGMAWKLHGIIDSFSRVSARLLNGAGGHPSLVSQVNWFAAGVDSASLKLLTIVSAASGDLSRQLDSLGALINNVGLFSRSASEAAPRYLSDMERVMAALEISLGKLETLTAKTLDVITAIDTSALGTGKDRITPLKKNIDVLHKAILQLKDRLLQVKVHL